MSPEYLDKNDNQEKSPVQREAILVPQVPSSELGDDLTKSVQELVIEKLIDL